MPLDISGGDRFIVDGLEYSIRKCNPWLDFVTSAVQSLMTKTADTKAPPEFTSGKRGLPEAKLSNVQCSPVWPASNEVREREALNTPIELFECYVNGDDTIYHVILENPRKRQ